MSDEKQSLAAVVSEGEEYPPLNVHCGLTLNATREDLGREVRRVWVQFCQETGDTKPSHIAPWEDLTEWEKEADRRIGEGVAKLVMTNVSDDSFPTLLAAAKEAEGLRIQLEISKEADRALLVDIQRVQSIEQEVLSLRSALVAAQAYIKALTSPDYTVEQEKKHEKAYEAALAKVRVEI